MKVRELIAQLKTVPQEMEVLLASDEEGNSFHELHQVSQDPMAKEGRYWEYNDTAKDSIVLWPA